MSILTAKVKLQKREKFASDLFSLVITQQTLYTKITMCLFTPTVTTTEIAQTLPILQKSLSSILASTCFNEANLPFAKEVKQTEIGHLFEHILLEYLCNLKLATGEKNPVYNGVTKWDWTKEQRGTFHIFIDSPKLDTSIFFKALLLSISLLEEILQYDPIKKRKRIEQKPFSYQLQ